MTAREYFNKEYGVKHISEVVQLKDFTSLFGLMEEYADKYAKIKCEEQREIMLKISQLNTKYITLGDGIDLSPLHNSLVNAPLPKFDLHGRD